METRSFNKKSLGEFIDSVKFAELQNIPISKQRAISQIHNPRADEDDILLVAQFEDNLTVGYLGILPDYIWIEGIKEKVGWLTCFWVHENYRSKGVAVNLFNTVIKVWEQKVFITNIVPWLEPYYQKKNIFKPTLYKEGLRGYLRFNLAEILPPKFKIFSKLKLFLKITDQFLNLFFDLRFQLIRKYKIKLKYELIQHLDSIASAYIEKNNNEYWNKRGQEELNWIIQFPWLIEAHKENTDSSRYYFSLISKRFINLLLKFADNEKNIVGIVLLNIRDNRLTVPYVFADESSIDEISKVLINKMIELKLNMITTFNKELISSMKRVRPNFIFTKTVKKPFIFPKQFEMIEEYGFQDGDGDCAFY